MKTIIAAAAAAFITTGSASAAILTIDANNASLGVAPTPPFGSLVQAVGTAAIGLGVDFSWGNVEGIFSDPPLAFCGISAGNLCTLVDDVDGRIVLANSLTQGFTSYVYAEAGQAPEGTLTLTVYDVMGNVLASATNDLPLGTYGRTTFAISRMSADIAFFRISGADTYGVNQIRIEDPGPGDAVPTPAGWVLALTGLGLVAAAKRRRTAA